MMYERVRQSCNNAVGEIPEVCSAEGKYLHEDEDRSMLSKQRSRTHASIRLTAASFAPPKIFEFPCLAWPHPSSPPEWNPPALGT